MHQDSVLSAVQLAMIAVVVVASLAAWLIAVFLAARPPHGTSTAGMPHRAMRKRAPP